MPSATPSSAAPANTSRRSSSNIPGVKVRVARPASSSAPPRTLASKTDADEAFLAGQAAVKAAIAGETDKMVTLVRGDTDHYTCETGLAPLSDIANGVKKLPARVDQRGRRQHELPVPAATPSR
jgi:hypothetical protein